MPSVLEMKRERTRLYDEMKAISDQAHREKRLFTEEELARWAGNNARLDQLKEIIETAEAREREEAVESAGGPSGPSFGQRIVNAGFSREKPEITLPLTDVVESRALTSPAVGNWARAPGYLSPLGRDERFMYPFLRQQRVDGESAILDFRQTARAVTGAVERALDATTTKAELDATVTAVEEQLKVFAILVSNVPNEILESIEALRAFLDSEMRFQVSRSIDSHVLAQIVAAGPAFGETGANIVERLRNGIGSMRGVGASPKLVVLNPTDSAALDLFADAGGMKFLPNGAPDVFGLQRVERSGADPIYLIDPDLLGILYLGDLSIQADPYSGFHQNTTRIRAEVKALFHVRQVAGARRVAAT